MHIRPIERDKRSFTSTDLFLLWAGVAISLAEIWAGGLLAPMGFGAAVAAILLGHVIGNSLMALGGVVGTEHGIPAMVSVRPAFGIRGSNFAALLNIVQLVCWASIMLIIGGRAGGRLGASLAPTGVFASERFWIVLIGVGTLAWALWTGHRMWKFLQGAAVFGLLGVVSVMTWNSWNAFRVSELVPTSNPMPFMSGLDLVIALPISWMPLVADYSRFAKSNRGAFWGTWWGYFIVSSWMFLLGLMATVITRSADPQIQMDQLLGGAGLAIPALVMVVLSTITSDFPDIYSATCSMLNVAPRFSAKTFMWGTGVLSIVVALVFPMDRYESFLFFIGAMFIPLFSVVLTDYFLVRRRELDIAELYRDRGDYWFTNGFNPAAFAAWAAGFVVYKTIEAISPGVGASLPSMATAAIAYLVLVRLRSPRHR